MGDGSLGDGMRECERFGDGQNCGGMKIFLRRRAAKSFTRKSLGLGLQARKERVVKGERTRRACEAARSVSCSRAGWAGNLDDRSSFLQLTLRSAHLPASRGKKWISRRTARPALPPSTRETRWKLADPVKE